ncbi:cyclin-like protein [Rhizoclosmatium globosum]|uniref:Cyclin-like protein n=1 Tax=Rhizoclosmatium globosum TaxID=329046 RepID=A0A1Y2BTE9_9FUNG|nr:hypothetical protein HDU79_009526 [Rhizoclosmatium sp. JEL0117]ORY37917.1 cyclin-like protein [Rhizoclosmatium globosum]|eukprot:ORY37917.1 cyclin-like protein [Rhizoclosmatium globosum]
MILANSVAKDTHLIRECAASGDLFKATNLIAQCGILLKLPQTAIATAQTILIRFYSVSSVNQYPISDTVLGVLFLASKTEECARKIKDIVNVYFALQIFNNQPNAETAAFVDVPYDTYNEYKDAIIQSEIHILARLGFQVHVQHPHGFMVNYLQSLGLATGEHTEFAQYCWNCLNDLVRTEVVVYFQPNVIACAAIYYGSRKLNVALPTTPPWWELFDAVLEDMEVISEHLEALYERGRRK